MESADCPTIAGVVVKSEPLIAKNLSSTLRRGARDVVVSCRRVESHHEKRLGRIDGGEKVEEHLDGVLVGGGGALVLLLVDLVGGGAHGTRDTAGDGVVGRVALGLLLVGLLGSGGTGTLNGLRDVLGGVVERVADLADNTLVGSVGVGSRHFDVWVGLVVWFEKRRLFGCLLMKKRRRMVVRGAS